ncbi:HlyD family secretion protein [Sphingomonas rhizophila]|uniref:HlyD family secretion protein n=1 Tax=Sphingomonas rhizophila TaxID=2071607 RepID=A0A7G9SCS4_9SPHN|nr:HlyD family secretion protein [Sphingomonas rhizophila]QNN65649.1 HlyD family secretion protein [Sphingomonas rhizophila]
MTEHQKLEAAGEATAEDLEAVKPARKTRKIRVRKPSNRVLLFSVPLLIAAVGLFFWLTGGTSVSTDNAYVKQDVTSISTQVNGPVAAVYVDENQHVNKGDLLYRIDPAPFRAALDAAEAQLAAARLQTSQLVVTAQGTGADIVGAQADLSIKRRALQRQSELLRRGFTTKANYDDALADVRKGETALADARARSNTASAAIAPRGDQPQIAAALAAVEKARLDLAHTEIRAPSAGIVAKSDRLLVGQSAITGVAMLSIVSDKAPWVEANFKEGDLARMKVGQPATIKFDAYPGLKVKAHVCSIGAGTGSEFAVLPAQNANGNWVKVTQRVPVRLCFDEKPGRQMIAGLSSEVEVDLK